MIDGRLARLKGIVVADDADREAQRFIDNDLSGGWESVKESILAGAGDCGVSGDHPELRITGGAGGRAD